MAHATCQSNGPIEGLFNQIHSLEPRQLFMVAAGFCESIADYMDGPYKDSYTRMVQVITEHEEWIPKINKAKADIANAVACWTTHPGKPMQFHQFMIYAVTQVGHEMVLILLAQPFLDDHDFDVLTSHYRKAVGEVQKERLTEIPDVFRSAFDISIATKSDGKTGSREVPEDQGRTESREEYFYDPSSS